MLLPNSKRLNLPLVATRLLFVELAAASPVYFEHTGRGDACVFPLSSTLLAMKCLSQGSWLRSAWKAFPCGPQSACALGAPTHTFTPTNAHWFNQPTQQKSRKGEEGKEGDVQLGLCHWDPSEQQERRQACERTECFHSSSLLKSKKRDVKRKPAQLFNESLSAVHM